jgi:hypothetical protein
VVELRRPCGLAVVDPDRVADAERLFDEDLVAEGAVL